MDSYRRVIKWLLWLSYRINKTLVFIIKFSFSFKFLSISYDYYLGLYPRIFNDTGFFLRFMELYNYLYDLLGVYYFESLFVFFMFIAVFSFFIVPRAPFPRDIYDHSFGRFKGKSPEEIEEEMSRPKLDEWDAYIYKAQENPLFEYYNRDYELQDWAREVKAERKRWRAFLKK